MAKRFELIVFDWDGTLMDSAAAIVRAIQAASADLGLPVPPGPAAAGDGAPVDADAALQALWRLREPQQRLIDQLFWYWPDGGGGDSLAVVQLCGSGGRVIAELPTSGH